MKDSIASTALLLLSCAFVGSNAANAQRQMENLTRGVVAVPTDSGEHLVSWRLFGTDPESIAFNLYRVTGENTAERINEDPITGATNCVVAGGGESTGAAYFVRPIVGGVEGQASAAASVWQTGFLEIPIQPIDGYRPGDASVADLDGDGEYEIVLQQSGRTHDNAHSGLTDKPVLDAYELDGTQLWRIDLGHNIRDGEHYTQFMVYDLDGDGRAEVACKTADGSTDGRGNTIGDANKDWRTKDERSPAFGRVLDGPEFLTIFDGQSGEALKSVDYVPNRDPIDGWGGIGGNGGNDSYGNRCDRFLACVAYLDGVRPSLVMCRGVYGRTVLAAWDWRDGELTQRWVFDSGISYPPFRDASPYSGMGGHSISVADVDEDGRDEIVYQAMVVDDNGEGLYSTGLRHGDAMHVSDMYPDRPGLEIFTVQENEGRTVRFQTPGAAMRDARTGALLWSHSPGVDVGAGLAADIDPRYRGYEAWGGPGGLRNSRGESIGPAPRSSSFAIWWDGDLLRELLGGSRVTKWHWKENRETTSARFASRGGRYPCLVGDIVGDWREEVLLPSPDVRALRLYTTPIPTEHRIHTLMHDPQYRLSIAWQNVVYNKPPHPSFFLGDGMQPRSRPDIRLVGSGEAINLTVPTRP
jgi:rhamnogalacturonan endolyase